MQYMYSVVLLRAILNGVQDQRRFYLGNFVL